MNGDIEYKVGMANGAVWIYYDKQKAENAALIARALAAMPAATKPGFGYEVGWSTSIAKYGQQSALARELGYLTGSNYPYNKANRPNHQRIYHLLNHGYLPRSPERRQKLRDIAARVPDDWYEQLTGDDRLA